MRGAFSPGQRPEARSSGAGRTCTWRLQTSQTMPSPVSRWGTGRQEPEHSVASGVTQRAYKDRHDLARRAASDALVDGTAP